MPLFKAARPVEYFSLNPNCRFIDKIILIKKGIQSLIHLITGKSILVGPEALLEVREDMMLAITSLSEILYN